MNTIAERIRNRREHLGLSQPQLAKLAGCSQGTISNLETGFRGKPRNLLALADALQVSPAWLETGQGDMEQSNVEPAADMAPALYPLISEVHAGGWTELCDNFQPGDADEWLPSTKKLGRHGYMLRVVGDSMHAPGQKYSFPQGMILHVNPDLLPIPGQFVVVRRNGSNEATFKKYILLDGEQYLEAINPDWPKERKYLKLQPDDDWCGVVVDASLGGMP